VTAETEKRGETGGTGLNPISEMVQPHLRELSRFMRGQVSGFEPEIRDLVSYCLDHNGKGIRPVLVFCSGWTAEEVPERDLVKAAAVIEFVHIATLVHDDILDSAILRRSDYTVDGKFGSQVAVLLGDAIFCQALHLASEFPNTEVCRAVSAATRRVCSGEIEQTLHCGEAEVSIDRYFRIIDAKTAELFRVSCSMGAKLGGYEEEFALAAGQFGRHLGIAYQIFDDLTDFVGSEERVGKTLGTDLVNGRVTLPLILLLQSLASKERERLIEDIRSSRPVELERINEALHANGIVEKVARYFRHEVRTGESTLAPYEKYPPVDRLLVISDAIKSLTERVLKEAIV
jgi:octaprenyl-diphosphate synthase